MNKREEREERKAVNRLVTVAHVWADRDIASPKPAKLCQSKTATSPPTARRHNLTIVAGNDKDFRYPASTS